jgi:hypothetical protein
VVKKVPNRKAKENKRKKALLTKKWAIEGRTAKQHKKWLTKQADKGITQPLWSSR